MHHTFIRFFIHLTAIAGGVLITGCSSSTWDDARQADSYEAYHSYITDNPKGTHLEEARTRADSSYWSGIENDTTASAFATYLKKFPEGRFRSEAQMRMNQSSPRGTATKGRITGSSIIIRSDHTTESPSAGVIAKKGTIVQILDRYNSGSSNEAILRRSIVIRSHDKKITLPKGKAIRILDDLSDSVHASFSTPDYGATQATINKDDIEAMSGQTWYKIHTNDNITGWIYGKFIVGL